MSSEILRGGPANVQPFPWKRVRGTNAADYFEPPALSSQGEEHGRAPVDDEGLSRQLEQARQEGFRGGEAEASKAGASRTDAMVAKLTRTIEELAAYRPRLRAEAEHDVVKLAMAIAKRIVASELNVDPDIVLALVKAGIQKLDARDISIVRSHPEDALRIRKYLETSNMPGKIQVEGDGSLERGAIVFTTSRGSLDVSVNTQLAEIERGFTDLMRKRS